MHEGERCFFCVRHDKPVEVYSQLFPTFLEHLPEHVVAYLSDERCLVSKFCEHGKHIAGSATGIRFEHPVSLLAQTVLCKIYEQFTDCTYIKLCVCFHFIPPLQDSYVYLPEVIIYCAFSICFKRNSFCGKRRVEDICKRVLSVVNKYFERAGVQQAAHCYFILFVWRNIHRPCADHITCVTTKCAVKRKRVLCCIECQ